MKCVKTVSYNFLRDGEIFREVIPQRRVRQGGMWYKCNLVGGIALTLTSTLVGA